MTQFSWEAVSAIASMISSLAVLVAIVVAIRQLRVGADQVDHLRRSTQLDGTMEIFDRLIGSEQVEARRFILTELSDKLDDPTYRAELALGRFTDRPHPETLVLRLMEMIGTYVKHGLIDEEIIFDIWVSAVIDTWDALERLGVIAAHREANGSLMWENFEFLAGRARRYLAAHDPGALLPWPAAPRADGTKS